MKHLNSYEVRWCARFTHEKGSSRFFGGEKSTDRVTTVASHDRSGAATKSERPYDPVSRRAKHAGTLKRVPLLKQQPLKKT